MPDLEGCQNETPMLMLNDNESQPLDGKGIKRQSLLFQIDLYAHERSFVPGGK